MFHSLWKPMRDPTEDVKQLLGKMRTVEFLFRQLVKHQLAETIEVPNEILVFWGHAELYSG
jgi:hypothetical protein